MALDGFTPRQKLAMAAYRSTSEPPAKGIPEFDSLRAK